MAMDALGTMIAVIRRVIVEDHIVIAKYAWPDHHNALIQ
jgi:hypothetical protein